jgi:hypothetical protein
MQSSPVSRHFLPLRSRYSPQHLESLFFPNFIMNLLLMQITEVRILPCQTLL